MKRYLSRIIFVLFSCVVTSANAGIVFVDEDNVTPEIKVALQAAANEIEQMIDFKQEIRISVSYTGLSCNSDGAILGFAGPDTTFSDFSEAPDKSLLYSSAQAADFGMASAMAKKSHINARFNNKLGTSACPQFTWYFGTDHNPPGDQLDFVTTAVHEFMHGMGFLSFIGKDGRLAGGKMDIFSSFLLDASTGKSWKNMSNDERAASELNDGNLVWSGIKTTSMSSLLKEGVTNAMPRLYAPSIYEGGSSTSHFDVSLFYKTNASEVMEPFDDFPVANTLSGMVFCDMGWQLLQDTDDDGVDDCNDAQPLLKVDTDGDGVSDLLDEMPDNPAESADTDDDSVGNNADTDDDNDSLLDASDNCPLVSNADQNDYDADGTGDACGDGVKLWPVSGVASKDGAGSAVAFAGDVNQDGYGDYIIGTPGFDVAATGAGAGRAVVISGSTGLVLFTIDGQHAKDALGSAVAGAGDVNGDGFDDVAVGAPREDDAVKGFVDAGSVTVFSGKDGTQLTKKPGSAAKDLFGSSVALGDVNNDGKTDIIVGAPLADDIANGLKDAGSVTVISGNGFTTLNTFTGATARANAGTSVAAGDINNDGDADIIVGAPNDGGTGSVTVYNFAGIVLLQKTGETKKAQLGKAVASGDVDKDSFDDVLAGSPGDFDPVNFLNKAGSVTVFSGKDDVQLAKHFGATAKAYLGSSVAAGDINGDGYADVIAGAPRGEAGGKQSIRYPGSVSVWRGDNHVLIKTLYGTASKDFYGSAVSAGDIDGDGKADLIIGVRGDDVPATRLLKDAGSVQFQSGAGL